LKINSLALSMCFNHIQNFIKGIDPKKYWLFNYLFPMFCLYVGKFRFNYFHKGHGNMMVIKYILSFYILTIIVDFKPIFNYFLRIIQLQIWHWLGLSSQQYFANVWIILCVITLWFLQKMIKFIAPFEIIFHKFGSTKMESMWKLNLKKTMDEMKCWKDSIFETHMDILHVFKIGKDSRWNTSHDRWKFQERLDLVLE
jgi:hypothetical protein